VEHRAFWIYPTGWHQNEHELSPEFREHLGETPRFAPDAIPLRVHCVVEQAIRVEDLSVIQRLAGMQPFSDETLAVRFGYRGKPYLHVLLVRAHVLREPRLIRNTAADEGCVSWVGLDEPVSTAGALPVLSDAQFAAVRRDVLARLRVANAPPNLIEANGYQQHRS
jgi:hypothetical protein